MSYSDQTRYEQLLGRVVPVPKQTQALDGAPLTNSGLLLGQ